MAAGPRSASRQRALRWHRTAPAAVGLVLPAAQNDDARHEGDADSTHRKFLVRDLAMSAAGRRQGRSQRDSEDALHLASMRDAVGARHEYKRRAAIGGNRSRHRAGRTERHEAIPGATM